MKKALFHVVFTFAFCSCLMACSGSKKTSGYTPPSDKAITTSTGLKYTIYENGSGEEANPGDIVKVHYVGKLKNDSVFDSSRERDEPLRFKLGAGQVIKGWEEGIAFMREGDKAKLVIPSELAYGEKAIGGIPANSTLIFDVELIGVIKPAKPFNVAGKDTISYASGLKMIKVHEFNSGVQASNGKTVTVHYTGFLPDGKVFDSSVDRGEPISFPLGTGKVIKGWEEGISYLKVGEKARLIIPPHLAYGAAGYPPMIPANSTLVFDVELMGVSE